MSRTLFFLLCASPLLSLGCGEPSTATTFSEIKARIKVSCALSNSCHSARSDLGNGMRLDLQTDPYTALVNAATLDIPNLPQLKIDFPTLVVPGNAEKSAVYVKLHIGTSKDPLYGDRMPQSSAADPELAAMFKSWINNGAPND